MKRAEDVLGNDTNYADFDGITVRKGTVGAFLANASVWSDPASSEAARAEAQQGIIEALPALRAIGLLDILEPRDPSLRSLMADVTSPA